MEKSPQTPAQPSEINEAQLEHVAGAGGLMIERRATAAEADTDTASRGIVLHD